MKNTAARVGPPEGVQGAGACRPPRRAQARRAEHGKVRTRPPGPDKKCVAVAGVRAGGPGGKPRKPAREGKPPDTLHAKHRASRKKPPEGHRCAERSESPGPDAGGAEACPPARGKGPPQEPDKGNGPSRPPAGPGQARPSNDKRPNRRGAAGGAGRAGPGPAGGAKRAEKPTRPRGRRCYARRRWGQRTPRGREMNQRDDRAEGARPAGRGRFRKPPSRGNANQQSRAHRESNNETSDSRAQGPSTTATRSPGYRDDRAALSPWARAHSARVRAADHPCLSRFRWTCVCNL